MKAQPRILVVEDEPAIAELVAIIPVVVNDGAAAQLALHEAVPDLIILDWMLPGDSGLTLAKRWRKEPHIRDVPIILLTARGDESDRVTGLESGADDYLVKPFSPRELMARVRAILRRSAPEMREETLTVGELVLDTATYRVSYGGQPLKLGPTEFKLLHHFMKHVERVHTRTQLLDRVWGDQVFIEERTVDVHIKRLREAMGEAAPLLETVRGAGYRLSRLPVQLVRDVR
jgi:two-component system, OmpR family, phosphate regulon response regulator PhoB